MSGQWSEAGRTKLFKRGLSFSDLSRGGDPMLSIHGACGEAE